MTLIPYMAGFVAGTVGWALGNRFGGMYGAIMVSLIAGSLGFYYVRRYMKRLKESMGL
jgi:positive regulator of sigma E activity